MRRDGLDAYYQAPITDDAAYAADLAKQAAHFHAAADTATDWTERDRLRRIAYALDDDDRFWARPS